MADNANTEVACFKGILRFLENSNISGEQERVVGWAASLYKRLCVPEVFVRCLIVDPDVLVCIVCSL